MQVAVALSAPATAYSHDPRKPMLEPPVLLVGSGIALVTLTQVRACSTEENAWDSIHRARVRCLPY